eukprot:m.196915 g.196915  ORF g.196915 m.196915 type:complete len:331 (+) comp19935_c0_seq1:110-1102(+)
MGSSTNAHESKEVSKEPSTAKIAMAIVAYSLCSSMMVVANKLAINAVQISAVVTQTQFVFATVVVLLAGLTGENIGPFSFEILKGYFIYIMAFAGGIYANMQGLKKLSPETTTVIRACLPLIVLVIECTFMGRSLPSFKSLAALGGVITGATAYFYVTGGEVKQNEMSTYLWVLAWYLLLAFQMTYGKMLVKGYTLSRSGQVLYQNAISIPVILALGVVVGDYDDLDRLSMSGLDIQLDGESRPYALLWLVISSVIGVGIGYTAWACRTLVTPTSFTLVGVVNKVLTILVSITFINPNATVYSVMALAMCIGCGMLYQPPPLRADEKKKA